MNNYFGFDIPNLDDAGCDPKEYLATALVLDIIAKYMKHKALAIDYRRKGNIQMAVHNEQMCDRLYVRLPTWAKW